MEVNIEITRMVPASGYLLPNGAVAVADFHADVFPFRIWNGLIRRRPDGSLLATVPGRKNGGISIASPELREAICAVALEMYEDKYGRS